MPKWPAVARRLGGTKGKEQENRLTRTLLERATRIELPFSAWEADEAALLTRAFS